MSKVIPIKPLTQTDFLEAIRRLRRLLTACDSAASTLYLDLGSLGHGIAEESVRARRHLEAAASKTYSLLQTLEATQLYKQLREDRAEES